MICQESSTSIIFWNYLKTHKLKIISNLFKIQARKVENFFPFDLCEIEIEIYCEGLRPQNYCN